MVKGVRSSTNYVKTSKIKARDCGRGFGNDQEYGRSDTKYNQEQYEISYSGNSTEDVTEEELCLIRNQVRG